MSKLVPILLAQHRALEARIQSIQAAIEARDATRAHLELPAVKAALAAHFRLEDEELYPGLVALGTEIRDAQLSALATTFASSMKQISLGLNSLLARHERRLELDAFAKDWSTFTSLLASRVRSKERTLFGLFDAAMSRKNLVIPKRSVPDPAEA